MIFFVNQFSVACFSKTKTSIIADLNKKYLGDVDMYHSTKEKYELNWRQVQGSIATKYWIQNNLHIINSRITFLQITSPSQLYTRHQREEAHSQYTR